MGNGPLPEFQRQQLAFAGHLRDPRRPAPAGVPEPRLALYRELFFNTIEGLLAGNFPVLRQTLPQPSWQALVRRFHREHHCQTPLFTEIGQELLLYLQQHSETLADYPDFMLELAHYEWMETELTLSDADQRLPPHDPNGDPLAEAPLFSPLARLLSYRYPVHQIGPGFQPATPPPEPSLLIVYRDRQDQRHFLELNALTYHLLRLLEHNRDVTGRQLLDQLARQLDYPQPARLIAFGGELLTDLRHRHILLGTHR